jgi:CheY-like chemotaxis protein
MNNRVLIIEDDPYVRRFYEKLFRLSKYKVKTAKGAEEGLAKAKATHPDLILLDIMMPKINGLEVLQKLKSDPVTYDCKVVMLTVLEDKETVRKAASLGADGYIIKSSASPKELIKIVSKYL